MGFNEDQIAEFQEAFLLYDQRGDGKIPVSQIGDVMRALGQNPTESDVKKLVVEHRADDREGFPTIKLIKAGDDSIVDFDGERTEAGFVKFLDAQVGAEAAASKDEL